MLVKTYYQTVIVRLIVLLQKGRKRSLAINKVEIVCDCSIVKLLRCLVAIVDSTRASSFRAVHAYFMSELIPHTCFQG